MEKRERKIRFSLPGSSHLIISSTILLIIGVIGLINGPMYMGDPGPHNPGSLPEWILEARESFFVPFVIASSSFSIVMAVLGFLFRNNLNWGLWLILMGVVRFLTDAVYYWLAYYFFAIMLVPLVSILPAVFVIGGFLNLRHKIRNKSAIAEGLWGSDVPVKIKASDKTEASDITTWKARK